MLDHLLHCLKYFKCVYKCNTVSMSDVVDTRTRKVNKTTKSALFDHLKCAKYEVDASDQHFHVYGVHELFMGTNNAAKNTVHTRLHSETFKSQS